MWKLLEIHRWKICAMVVILSALSQPSACYLFPALLWILGLPFRNLDLFVYILTLVWASLMLLFNMIYQLEFVHVKLWDRQPVFKKQAKRQVFHSLAQNLDR